jgi:hypothetical protein
MPLFNRFATASIGEPGATGIFVEGLRVKFSIEKSNRGTPNKAVVQIFNMSARTRSNIAPNRDVLIFEAGYRDDDSKRRLAIQMDIVDAQIVRQKPDIVTALVCADGMNTLRNKKISVSFKGGSSVKQILADVAKQAGVVLRDAESVDDAQYQNGFAAYGPVGDILNSLVGRNGSEWSFQNGDLQVAPKDAPAGQFETTITKETGMIGSPTKRSKIGAAPTPGVKSGWIVSTLLNPTLEPNGRVTLQSEDANGVFRILTVKHVGDTDEGQFQSTIEVEEW